MSPRFLCLFASALPARLLAAESVANAVPPAPVSVPDLGGSALQMILGLLIVFGLLLATLWLLKRLSQPRGAVAGLMRVIAGVAVGPRERVVILELGNSWLVLGVAPGQVTTLAEIPRQAIPPEAKSAPLGELPSWLRQWAERRGKA